MIQLFKKANDKAGAEVDPKDPTKQKWNADTLFVRVDNEMVPLAELAKHADTKENEFVPIQEVENELEINGSVHNVDSLISRYQAAKKKNRRRKRKRKRRTRKIKRRKRKKPKRTRP